MSFVIVKKIQVIKKNAFLDRLRKVKQQKFKLSTPTAISKNVNLFFWSVLQVSSTVAVAVIYITCSLSLLSFRYVL